MEKVLLSLLSLLIMIISNIVYAQDDFTVEVLYFNPADSKPISIRYIQKVVSDTEQLYAYELNRNGFDKRTFRTERDSNGEIKVHTIKGEHNWQHYISNSWERILPELPDRFNPTTPPWDKQDRIRLIVVGGATTIEGFSGGIGWSYHSGRYGGNVIIAGGSGYFDKVLTFHEIGHAFGLFHKPLRPGIKTEELEYYEARWIDKSYHFNRNKNKSVYPKVDVNNYAITTTSMNTVVMEISVESNFELHQAVLVRSHDIRVLDLQYLEDEHDTLLFLKSDFQNWSSDIIICVIDKEGNHSRTYMTVHIPDSCNVRNASEKNELTGDITPLSLMSDETGSLSAVNNSNEWYGWTTGVWEKSVDGSYPARPKEYLTFPYMDIWEYWIYSHASSRMVWDLTDRNYSGFRCAFYLPNPSCGGGASVKLIALADDVEIYNSGELKLHNTQNKVISFEIPNGSQILEIKVDELGNDHCDHFVLGNPSLLSDIPGAPSAPEKTNITTWGALKK